MIVAVVLVNVTLTALSWTVWFGGNAGKVGFADRIFGNARLGGFRADVVWLVLSTLGLAFGFFHSLSRASRDREARLNALLCCAGVIAFVLFLYHSVTAGVLDFG
ncbi:MAG TPA: hypothetical protein VGM11_10265 [Acidobacteriaceae bacterium]